MAFLSSKALEKRISKEKIVTDYRKERLKYAAYELSMGNEAFVTTDEKKKIYNSGDQVVIHPGQFAILITHESIKVPTDLIAFISIKFSIKSAGLINVSGFHVDPGFEGKLKFSVYNAGAQNVILTVGVPTFQIWFSKITDDVKYNGNHNGQDSISADDVRNVQGKLASPSALSERIEKLDGEVEKKLADLRGKLNTQKTILGIVIAFISALVIFFLSWFVSDSKKTTFNSSTETSILGNELPDSLKSH